MSWFYISSNSHPPDFSLLITPKQTLEVAEVAKVDRGDQQQVVLSTLLIVLQNPVPPVATKQTPSEHQNSDAHGLILLQPRHYEENKNMPKLGN